MGIWGAPGNNRNNRDGLIIKQKVGAEVFNEEESLFSISGKEIVLKASMEGRQLQDCVVYSSKFEILLEKHRNSGRCFTNEF